MVQPGKYPQTINHYNVLRAVEDLYNLPRVGNSATAAAIAGVWKVLPGDANLDGAVNFDDLVVPSQNYNTTGKTWPRGDFTGDGKVDFNDLVILAQQYTTTLPSPPAAAMAPAATSVVRDRPAAKPIFSVTPVAKPTIKPKAAVPQRRR